MTTRPYILMSKGLLIAMSLCLLWSCTDNESSEPNYQLVWQDEFEGSQGSLPDSTKWTFDVGTNWGNNQLEYDTDRAENVSLDGEGHLAIVARKESYEGSAYTSGRIKTQGLFAQTYGRFEASIKVPGGQGIWPAFWMLGDNFDDIGWPQCGEIDIMELRGQEPTVIHGTLHGPNYFAGNGVSHSYTSINDRFDNGFHTYRVDWQEDVIAFYADGIEYGRVTPEDLNGEWVFDHPFFILLNLAVGGSYVGSPNVSTPFPRTMLVDYVRVYQQTN